MNKSELAAAIAEETGLSKKQAEAAVNAFIHTVTGAVAEDDAVQLIGFGTFEKGSRAARTGRNPRTGETLEIPAVSVPRFKPGKAFKDAVK